MLTSATRGETLTPNPNECNSMLTSGTRGIYPYLYIAEESVPRAKFIDILINRPVVVVVAQNNTENQSDSRQNLSHGLSKQRRTDRAQSISLLTRNSSH